MITVTLPYFYLLWNYSLNIPHGDDFYAIINFFKILESKTTFLDYLQAMFYTEKEHVNLVTRLIAVIQYKFTNELNFRYYTFIGNIFLLGVVIVFFKEFKKYKLSNVTFIPFLIVLLNISYWEITIKGLMAIQHFGVIFFTLLSFYLIENKRDYRYTFLAFISCLIATYTFGNGILSLIINVVFLFLQGRKKELILWSFFTFILLIIMYLEVSEFTNYGIRKLPLYIKVRFFFNLFAGILGSKYLYSSFFVGVIILSSSIILLLRNQFYKNNSFYASTVLFVIGSYLLTTIQRGDRGVMVSFIARYPIYSSIIIGVIYLILLTQFEFKFKHWILTCFIASFLNINSWFTRFDNGVIDRIELSKKGFQNWVCTKNNFWLRDGVNSIYNFEITNQMNWFFNNGYYNPPYDLLPKNKCNSEI